MIKDEVNCTKEDCTEQVKSPESFQKLNLSLNYKRTYKFRKNIFVVTVKLSVNKPYSLYI